MSAPLAILGTGLVTSVGLSAAATCAALRAKLTNPTDTQFIDASGRWIVAHQVQLPRGYRGIAKLAEMAAMAISEALRELPPEPRDAVPLLLCTSEPERPGRAADHDTRLFAQIEQRFGARFHKSSAILPKGRVGVAFALQRAREIVYETGTPVVIAAADSLLEAATLSHYGSAGRLLTEGMSDGFMPGEGAGALLVGRPDGTPRLHCTGLGFATEAAHIDSGEPLRAEGLTHAVKEAVAQAGVALHEMDFRITDISGEQYYFKEAALALSRSMRKLKEEFDLWHPAECIGETGALAGIGVVAAAEAACRKAYASGPAVLAHWSNDNGLRAAATLHFGVR